MEKHIQTMAGHLLKLFVCSLMLMNTQVYASGYANITFMENAVAKGAVCLDGSPPAYAHAQGYGEGANNWVIYLMGGGWCDSKTDCVARTKDYLGNSTVLRAKGKIFLGGILDGEQPFNPDFYNWNRVYVLYCDGASFMADIEAVDPETNLHFRGARVFNAVMEDLLAKGMKDAKNAILSGGSAGGLATILHCDYFRGLVPNAARVKCVSDSGFFLRAQNHPGAKLREDRFANVVALHELAKSLPASCTSKMSPGLCLFPENLVGDIQTPLFILESAFDSFQIGENVAPVFGGKPKWDACINNLTLCTSEQVQAMKDYRAVFIDTLQKLNKTPSRGMYVDSCFIHGHFHQRGGWSCSSVVGNYALENKTYAKAIGDWYFDRSSFQHIDTVNDVPRNCTSPLRGDAFDNECRPHLG